MSPKESAPPGSAAPARLEPSLYERAGGRRKLAILVRNFYSSLQIHPVLGPIFARHIVDWPTHYNTLTNFWCLQTGGPSGYSGKLVAAHQPLGIQPTHFAIWLDQWRRSCHLHFDEPEATAMITLAEGLGRRMQETLTGSSIHPRG